MSNVGFFALGVFVAIGIVGFWLTNEGRAVALIPLLLSWVAFMRSLK
jgi:hypothetical protein